ncbi:MAG: tRNA 2-thiouridine(34) synthase MnmA, partial [Candidatus Aerophobetes bacterium]|nr:tRNA 2-thiouridine(34) synthase MnmA [Candidatus Aerophobetes bacterium]
MKKKVAVAMSGGIDSSVCAALLKEKGYEVIGITMQIWTKVEDKSQVDRCCGVNTIDSAKRAADELKIPHYMLNFRDIFEKYVIANFCDEYTRGRTPNPCIRCNQYIKFGALLKKAKQLGADYLATGHYAKIAYNKEKGEYLLKKGTDPEKDQSYFLYTMTQSQLKNILMPLGNYTKSEVRKVARDLNLPVADRPESQEICFIPDNDYSKFLKKYIQEAARPGPILNARGERVGEHRGILFYTIGQRRGLGISVKV